MALKKGTRRTLDLEEAVLEIRDDQGEPLTDRLLWARVTGWRPSSYGTDLIDLALDGELFTPVPDYARPVWERWLVGRPGTPAAWAASTPDSAKPGLISFASGLAGALTLTGRLDMPTNSTVGTSSTNRASTWRSARR